LQSTWPVLSVDRVSRVREVLPVESPAIVAAVLLAIVAAVLTIWLVPRWQVQRWRRAGIASDEKLAELGLQARSSITQALGGLALIVTIAITADQAIEARRSADETQGIAAENLRLADENLRIAEQGQVSERFLGAVEQLGATNDKGDAVDVRTGALFSLMRVGLDSPPNAEPVFRAAAAYVGNNYEPPKKLANHGCQAEFDVRADVAVALRFVLPAVAKKRLRTTPGPLAGLRGTTLNGLAVDDLYFSHFDLSGIKLRGTSLNGSDFSSSRLWDARFDRACLRNADFRHAHLRGARFDGAVLKGAKFTQADLDRAPLSEAQKRDVIVVSR
jgi:Pentapeptide repeats (8 copies)